MRKALHIIAAICMVLSLMFMLGALGAMIYDGSGISTADNYVVIR